MREVLVALVALLLGLGCERLPNAPASHGQPATRGITFVDWSNRGYASSAAAQSIAELAATGANSVTVIVTGYQSDRSASLVRADDPRTPSSAAVASALSRATELGLATAIKPHVDLDDGSWRGRIDPSDPSAWFASYREFLLPWAVVAASAGARQFAIGTELAGTLDHEAEWRATIAAVRAVFSGELTYAASWDEADRVPFWGALDLVGVDFYFPVTERKNPGRLEILAGWQPWLERLERLHKRTGRDIVLTEIGYRSVDGAGMHPYAFGTDDAIDLGEQADLYWAALEAIAGEPWLCGLTWWNWPAVADSSESERDFTPRGKPAADELRSAWGGGS